MNRTEQTKTEFLKEIGAKGGAQSTPKKTRAVRKNLKKAREALAAKRNETKRNGKA